MKPTATRPASISLRSPLVSDGSVQSAFVEPLALLRRDAQKIYGAGVELVPVQLLERLHSHVMKVAVRPLGGTETHTHVFLKISKRRTGIAEHLMQARVENDFATTLRVHETMVGSEYFGAVRPIGCYPGHLAIAVEEVAGETLLARLEREAAWQPRSVLLGALCEAMENAGRWIRAFQGAPVADIMTSADVRTYIDLRLLGIARAGGTKGEALRSGLLRRIDQLGQRASSVHLVQAHADLSPSNIMIDGRRIVVIDFATARLGHPLQDAARLFTQLDLVGLKPRFRPAVIARMQQALLTGFAPDLDADDAAFRLQVVAQRVNHLASLMVRRYSTLEWAYNWFVRRQHWRWLEAEVAAASGTRRSSWA